MMRLLFLIVLTIGIVGSARAVDGSITPGSSGPRATTVNGKTVFNWSQTGTAWPTSANTPSGATPIQYGNLGIAKNPAGGLNVGSRVSMPLPGAREAPIDVVGRMSPGKLVAGARILSKLVPIIQIATVAPELYNWFNDAGVQFNPESTGEANEFLRKDPSVCTTAPCYRYRMASGQPWYGSLPETCANGVGYVNSLFGGAPFSLVSSTGVGGVARCNYIRTSSGATYAHPVGFESVAPAPAGWIPATAAQVQSQLEQNSPGPGIAREFLDNGVPLEVENVTASGPASVPGGTSQVTQPNGNVATTITTFNITYAGNTVNVTRSETTNIYNPTTGETQTSESESEEVIEAPTDTALPGIPSLYVKKYPDGLGGVWAEKKAELMATSIGQLATQLMPNISGAGQCPAWPIPLDFAFIDFGTHDVAPPCWIWPAAAVFVVIGALLLARGLIFGG